MFERSRKGENALLIQPFSGPADPALLEEFAELCGDENTPLHKGFFDRAKEFFR